MNDKIMAGQNLRDISDRLHWCLSMFRTIHSDMNDESDTYYAMFGACCFLQGILKDFSADIDSAKDYQE